MRTATETVAESLTCACAVVSHRTESSPANGGQAIVAAIGFIAGRSLLSRCPSTRERTATKDRLT